MRSSSVSPLTVPNSLLEFILSSELGGGIHVALILLGAWLAGSWGMYTSVLYLSALYGFSYWHTNTMRVRRRLTWNLSFIEREPHTARALLGTDFPSWVCLSSVERSQWFQDFLTFLWPGVRAATNKSLSSSIGNLVTKTLAPSSKVIFDSLTLRRMDIGSIPLTVDGVQVHRTNNATAIDLHMYWAGNGIVQLKAVLRGKKKRGEEEEENSNTRGNDDDANTNAANRRSFFITLSNIQIKGILRLTLGPHCHAWPCMEAVGISFVGSPLVDFRLDIGFLPFDALPGMSSVVERLISDYVDKTLRYPLTMAWPITTERLDGYDGMLEPVGCAFVTVRSANGLPMPTNAIAQLMGVGGYSYVRASYHNGDPNKRLSYRTRTSKGANPFYDDAEAAAVGAEGGNSVLLRGDGEGRLRDSHHHSYSSSASVSASFRGSPSDGGEGQSTAGGSSSSTTGGGGGGGSPLPSSTAAASHDLLSQSVRMQFPVYGVTNEAIKLEVRKARSVKEKVVSIGAIAASPLTDLDMIGHAELSAIDLLTTRIHRLALRGPAVDELIAADAERPVLIVATEYRAFRKTGIFTRLSQEEGGGRGVNGASSAYVQNVDNGAVTCGCMTGAALVSRRRLDAYASSARGGGSFSGNRSSPISALMSFSNTFGVSAAGSSSGLFGGGGGGGSSSNASQSIGGLLVAHIVRADNLKAADLNGLSDPFVVVRIGRSIATTPIVFATLSPKFDRMVYLNVEDATRDYIELRIFDYDRFSANDLLGSLTISVSDVLHNGGLSLPKPYALDTVGTITLGFKLMQFELMPSNTLAPSSSR